MNPEDYKKTQDEFRQEYKEKLIGFNNSEKYKVEMAKLNAAMNIEPRELVLDYGAGLGTMRDFVALMNPTANIFAFDVVESYYQGDPDFFRMSLHFHLDKVYFMHSLAHIEDPENMIRNLADKFMKNDSEIWILTPNQNHLDQHEPPEGWTPDPTVIEHFTPETLGALLMKSGAYEARIYTEPGDERIVASAKFNSLKS